MTRADYLQVGILLLVTAAAGTILGLTLGALWHQWRALGEPQIIESVTCTQCTPGGRPPCTCPANCGSDRCAQGHHTTLDMFTAADVEFLRGVERAGIKPAPRRRAWHRPRPKKAGTR